MEIQNKTFNDSSVLPAEILEECWQHNIATDLHFRALSLDFHILSGETVDLKCDNFYVFLCLTRVECKGHLYWLAGLDDAGFKRVV